jgi:Tfp pilus assembly pilus retraction ATPase PilT
MANIDKLLDDIRYVFDIHIISDLSPMMRIDGKLLKAYGNTVMHIKLKNLITEGNCTELGILLKLKKSLEY